MVDEKIVEEFLPCFSRKGDMLEVEEKSTGSEHFIDLGVELAFSFIGLVVDGEAGYLNPSDATT